MAHEGITRRLAAIVAADMVGFSRLMQLDEAGTVARQKACLDELIKPKIEEFGGRLVKTTGDGLLLEFPSAVDAVLCCVAVQRAMPTREADIPENRRIDYRIGINLGEIILEGDDIFGDGVNIAARLETLADPGGILISRAVYSNVRGKLDLGYSDLGPQTFKNIAEPVVTYEILLDPKDKGKIVEAVAKPNVSKWVVIQASLALVLVLALVVGYVTKDSLFAPGPETEDLPRLLVLPFKSANDVAEIYANGATENLILSFSRMKGITTVPRVTALEYRGLDPDPVQLAGDLAIQYVLDGSAMLEGDILTLSARLREVVEGANATGKVVWQETVTGESANAFKLFTKLKAKTAASMQMKLNAKEREILAEVPEADMKTYLSWIKTAQQFRLGTAIQGQRQALQSYEQILEQAPNFKRAQIGFAWANFRIWYNSWNTMKYTLEAKSDADNMLAKLFAANPDDAEAIELKVSILIALREREKALTVARGAIFDQPQEPVLRLALGEALLASGMAESAREEFDKYLEISPRLNALEIYGMAANYLRLNDPNKAFSLLLQVEAVEAENLIQYSLLTEAHARLGNIDLASDYQKKAASIFPFSSLAWSKLTFDIYKDPNVYKRYSAAMIKAGMPARAYNLDKTLADDRLNARDLKSLFDQAPFKAKESIDPLGQPFELTVNDDGTFHIKFIWVAHRPGFPGKWQIKGDQVCFRLPAAYRGQEICSHYYLDRAKSTPDTKHVIWLDVFGPFKFAIEKIED